jgi:hypothetical protein
MSKREGVKVPGFAGREKNNDYKKGGYFQVS